MMWTEGGGKGSGGGRASSVECDPSCRMAAAFLGAQCEYETLIDFGVRNSDICKQLNPKKKRQLL